MQAKTTILGVDPGSQLMGYALLEIQNNKPMLITMDVLSLTKYDDIYERLEKIHTKICSLISTYQPKMFAIEAPFFGKNVQSMLKLGRAQGVAIAAAMQYKIPVTEYSPKKVKQSITGNGNASKEQVWKMLQQILHIQEAPKYLDASDALSVALCHYYQTHHGLGQTQQKFKSWEHYIQLQEKKVQKK
ncbi:crossover junction endodeoxyribonuclease RuvC [Hydrotalea sandarakina]|jgi:crossover junction endodeoxyribonuclease RuvC|uniref:Crossover junction endodeoxyribonuclease RuvC n=1 Tax=Hydrotalea sandarakina TaxID=1004304 RepID=A0A2W7RSH0_9BACT|nr:crossover junction endodeoxyribonuclease RuvC [Hydrotalea sandarakina]PZX61460.1 Holliday junction endonuclease RuvC [Hydrotalea sandarakina]